MSYARFLVAALAAATPIPTLSAQSALCAGPDGLDVFCCQPAALNVPNFPQLIAPGLAPTWTSCQVTAQPAVQVRVSPPLATDRCGEWTANLEVVDTASGATVLSGTLVLDYTRTFGETIDVEPTPEYQVWRFAAKVDLGGTPPFASKPACVGPTPAAFYYGYMDYAQRCGGPWEGALVLYHGCDEFMHAPGLSAAPGVFHPDVGYAVVAPSTAANPFLVQTLVPVGGLLMDEGTRTLPAPGAACVSEDPSLGNGTLLPFGRGCACTLTTGARQQSVNRFESVGLCADTAGLPSSYAAQNMVPSGLPWLRMVTTSIGHWTTGMTYPGPEEASVSEGFFLYHDSCANGGAGADYADLAYGATTAGGFAFSVAMGEPVPKGMVDLASNYSLLLGAPAVGPFLGRVLSTRHLIYTNVY